MDVGECQKAFVFHIFMGYFFSYDKDTQVLPCYPDCTVCCYISADFVSEQELITAAFEIVFTANAKIFSTSHLVIVA